MSILAKGKPPRVPQIPEGAKLSGPDAAYLEARGVSREAATAAGCYTAARPSEIPAAFSERQRRRAPALVVPHPSPDGESVGYQKRDHRPGKDRKGKPIKWVSPPAERARTVISVHPWTAEEVTGGCGPLWVVEGITRMLALADRGIAAVSYAGCYSWQKDREALEDWQGVNLAGRLVYDVPDADARINWQVQEMQAARIAYFESRGARVLAVGVPEVNGDEHAGLDDYLAAGGELEALARRAAPFEPADVGAERLTKDERLRRIVAAKIIEAAELPARKAGECNAVKVARYFVGTLAPARGKVRPRGVEVRAAFREIAEGVRLGSLQTVSKALDLLDGAGFLEIQRAPKGGRAASSYLLLNPSGGRCALGVHVGGLGGGGREGQEGKGEKGTSLYQRDSYASVHPTHTATEARTLLEKVPALRNSKLVHTFEYKGSRRVVVDSQYFRRYGSKRELIVRHLLDWGACVETAELMEKFGSKTARPGRFFEVWIKPMVKDGVLRGDAGSVELAPGWREALERVKARTDEDEDNRRQSEKYARQRRDRRARFAGERRGTVAEPEPTPELMGPERVREIFAGAAERDHAARVEEQRRKAGTTPETFIADALEGLVGFGWRELGQLWAEKGGRREDLARVVRDPANPYRLRRDDAGGDLYVERAGSVERTPKKTPAEVLPVRPENLTKPDTGAPPERDTDVFRNNPMHAPKTRPHASRETMTNDDTGEAPRELPPKVAGVYTHGPECACWICGDESEATPAERVQIGASA
jgi:hypothetical protein